MARIIGKFEILKFDGIRFNEEMKRNSTRLMKLAAIQFLKAATARIPIRTGFAAGSFDPLANALGVSASQGPRNTFPRGKEYYYLSKGAARGQNQRILKTRPAGSGFGSPKTIERILQTAFPSTVGAFKIVSFFSGSKPSIEFSYGVTINYLAVNESKWKALEAGRAAFIAFLRTNAKSIVPRINEFMIKDTLTLG